MNYKNIKVPFLREAYIKQKANLFRRKFWNSTLPVDIEKIIDVRLKMDIIPVPHLVNYCDTDALIASNWRSIYVDYDRFMDDRQQNRLRFSLAHELGHYILHKNIYRSLEIKSFDDFYNTIDQMPGEQYGYLETQANKFASHLLVPRQRLKVEREKLLKKVKNTVKDIDEKFLNSYIARFLSNVFGVSAEVIEIALSEF